ncbi:MAG: hypothetical protein DRP02_10520 [Candidatus Gerdarchaeota archaeon]|nr:MAG: hypothetical protein DRO63_04080 [Candidatus Gerdarchaeota archaeon]RLI69465.1 MAG: hypothetical protein DRP02_10520 [Candidatus Gerdarchaeota archaeon]
MKVTTSSSVFFSATHYILYGIFFEETSLFKFVVAKDKLQRIRGHQHKEGINENKRKKRREKTNRAI